MSSKQALRRRTSGAAFRSSLSLECLESRLALTIPVGGNVTAKLVGSTLLLTGDALDNALVVAPATGGLMAVLGAPGTTINGTDTTVTSFVTTRAVTSIVANLNAGTDLIGFTNNAFGFYNQLTFRGVAVPFNPADLQITIDTATGGISSFTLSGSLTVTTASGDDAVGIIGTVGGSVAVDLGSSSSTPGPGYGNDFAIGNPFTTFSVANRIGGSVSVVGGDQRDGIRIIGTDVGGTVSAVLGNGVNFARIDGYGSTFGSFAYRSGTGDDGVLLLATPLTIRDGVSVSTGPRGEDVVIVTATTIGGSVVVNTGTGDGNDRVAVESAIRGRLSVITGAGNDLLYVSAPTIGGGLAINSGAGDDDVTCSSITVAFNTVIDAGAGNDRVLSSGLTTRSNLFVYLGAGNDQLELYDARAFAVFLYGGTGSNSLTTNAATRSGIRTLRWFQFQTVNNI